jgi:hypothetical protein
MPRVRKALRREDMSLPIILPIKEVFLLSRFSRKNKKINEIDQTITTILKFFLLSFLF